MNEKPSTGEVTDGCAMPMRANEWMARKTREQRRRNAVVEKASAETRKRHVVSNSRIGHMCFFNRNPEACIAQIEMCLTTDRCVMPSACGSLHVSLHPSHLRS